MNARGHRIKTGAVEGEVGLVGREQAGYGSDRWCLDLLARCVSLGDTEYDVSSVCDAMSELEVASTVSDLLEDGGKVEGAAEAAISGSPPCSLFWR